MPAISAKSYVVAALGWPVVVSTKYTTASVHTRKREAGRHSLENSLKSTKLYPGDGWVVWNESVVIRSVWSTFSFFFRFYGRCSPKSFPLQPCEAG